MDEQIIYMIYLNRYFSMTQGTSQSPLVISQGCIDVGKWPLATTLTHQIPGLPSSMQMPQIINNSCWVISQEGTTVPKTETSLSLECFITQLACNAQGMPGTRNNLVLEFCQQDDLHGILEELTCNSGPQRRILPERCTHFPDYYKPVFVLEDHQTLSRFEAAEKSNQLIYYWNNIWVGEKLELGCPHHN